MNYKESFSDKIITIIIPAYNMENYLEKCCNSLLIKHNFEHLEILIINDGSKDDTSLIGHRFAKKYPDIFKIIDKDNGNYGSCINYGLKQAKGKFIKILDADDTYDTEGFDTLVSNLIGLEEAGINVDLIITDKITVDENGECTEKKVYDFIPNVVCNSTELLPNKMISLTQHAVIYKTENLKKMNYVQTEKISYTDQEWARLPMLSVQSFIYYPIQVYRYLVGRSGQTMDPVLFAKNYWMQIEIKKHMLDYYDSNKNSFPIHNQRCLESLLVFHLNNLYRGYLLNKNLMNETEEIEKFDKWLEEKHNHFFVLTNDIKLKKYFPFKYIKFWRINHVNYKWKYSIFVCLYSTACNIASRFKNKS